jgi:hypothetical protein
MGIEETVVEIAKQELAKPTLSDVARLLKVHKLAMVNDQLSSARVKIDDKNQRAQVYFDIEDEPYYFVLTVDYENKTIGSVYIETKYRVYLRIISNDIPPSYITNCIGIIPTETGLKKAHHKEGMNFWHFEPQKDIPDTVECKLEYLLDTIENKKQNLISLESQNCIAVIEICYEGYTDWLSGLHFDFDSLKRIVDLGLHIDIDMYASGPEMPSPDDVEFDL